MSDYTEAPPRWPARRRTRGKPVGHWRVAAHEAIEAALAAGRALALEGRALELHVSRHGYPFGERRNHPYRVWLHEFHRIVRGYRGPMSSKARKRIRERAARGQLVLFM